MIYRGSYETSTSIPSAGPPKPKQWLYRGQFFSSEAAMERAKAAGGKLPTPRLDRAAARRLAIALRES